MGAPCVKVCPVNAIRQCEDGCVAVDEKTCVGCKLCAIACPFGAVHMGGTPISGVAGIEYPTPTFVASTSPILQWEIGVYACAVKCDLCSFKEEGPSCVSVCPTRSIRLIDEESRERISAEKHRRAAVLGDFVADPYVLRSR
jgi:hydrogenase-4 component A